MTIANKQTYNITFSINRAHLLFMCVTLYSLLKNNQEYNFNIYVLHNNCLNDKEINNITNKHPLNQYNNFKITSHIEVLKDKKNILYEASTSVITVCQQEILFKLFLPEVFKNIDTILHLDTDVMVRSDISNLFEIENNILFKGCSYSESDVFNNNDWLNAGVMLHNLKLARELKTVETISNHLKENTNSEEYIINNLFKENRNSYSKDLALILTNDKKNMKIDYKSFVAIHFITKPFDLNSVIPNKVLYMEYQEYMIDFIKNKIKFRLLIMNSFIFTILLSFKRRIIHSINKRILKRKVKTTREMFNNNTYMKNKLYKYSIIGKK